MSLLPVLCEEAARGAKNRSADGVCSACCGATHRLQCDQSFVCDGAQAEVLPQAIDQCQPQRQPEEQPAGGRARRGGASSPSPLHDGVRRAALLGSAARLNFFARARVVCALPTAVVASLVLLSTHSSKLQRNNSGFCLGNALSLTGV